MKEGGGAIFKGTPVTLNLTPTFVFVKAIFSI